MKLSVRGGYGSAFLRDAGNDKAEAARRIKRGFCHAQATVFEPSCQRSIGDRNIGNE